MHTSNIVFLSSYVLKARVIKTNLKSNFATQFWGSKKVIDLKPTLIGVKYNF